MLEHQKIVLHGVKDDKKLFKKELIKSLTWLDETEQEEFRKWIRENFSHLHPEILNHVLSDSRIPA